MANKKLSKRYEAILRAYQNSNLTCLHECYGSWSWAKEHAYNYCKGLCDRMNGYDFKIVSYNTNMFSIAFLYQSDGKTMLHYETNKTTLDFDVSGHIYTYEDFEDDYNNLSDETKQHLANSGVCVHSMGEAEDLMKSAKMFDAFSQLFKA